MSLLMLVTNCMSLNIVKSSNKWNKSELWIQQGTAHSMPLTCRGSGKSEKRYTTRGEWLGWKEYDRSWDGLCFSPSMNETHRTGWNGRAPYGGLCVAAAGCFIYHPCKVGCYIHFMHVLPTDTFSWICWLQVAPSFFLSNCRIKLRQYVL